MAASDTAATWVRVGVLTPGQRRRVTAVTVSGGGLFLVLVGFQAVLAPLIRGEWELALTASAAALAAIGVVVLAARRRYRPYEIAADGRALRRGSRAIEAPRFERAVLERRQPLPAFSARAAGGWELAVRLIAEDGARVRLLLRLDDTDLLDTDTKRALLALVERSSIAMPASVHDPEGRFARFNFPGHIDKAGIRTLLEHAPGPDEALPASY